jgi:hypothetical protein
MNFSAAAASAGTLTSTVNVNSPAVGTVSGLSTTVSVLTPVKLLDFDLKSTNSAINVTSLQGLVTLSAGVTGNMVASVELRDGMSVLGSVTPTLLGAGTGGAATATLGYAYFTGLNVNVPQDGTKTLSIWVQMNPIGGPGAGYTTSGVGVKASILPVAGTPASNLGTIATDANYTTVTDTTATFTGYYQYMYHYAPTVTFNGASTPVVTFITNGSGTNQQMTGTLSFSVKANGQDEYVTATPNAGTPKGIILVQEVADATPASTDYTLSQLNTTSTDAVLTGDVFLIPNGATRTFTTSYKIVVAAADGYNGAKLSGFWLTNNTDGITSAVDFAYALPAAIGPQAYIQH